MFKVDQKIVIVTRLTRLQALRAKYATLGMARFSVSRAVEAELLREVVAGGGPAAADEKLDLAELAAEEFHEYEEEHELYDDAVTRLRRDLDDFGPKVQVIERGFLPNFVFGPNDVVVTVGQDGLVANTAKYALQQPIVATNPDPKRIDGVLLPFSLDTARGAVRRVLEGRAKFRQVTLAEAVLPAGQRMLAFNDLFIGTRSHTSARYRIKFDLRNEPQSSSGVIVSTGAGSTGWLSSIFNMAAGLPQIGDGGDAGQTGGGGGTRGRARPGIVSSSGSATSLKLAWEDPRLAFVVREPFVSKHSGAGIVAGLIDRGKELVLESLMPAGGVIFSDGIESDFLPFQSGDVARIRAAKERARLVVP